MGIDQAAAAVVICCRVPARITAVEFADWEQLARRAATPVTWVAGVESLATIAAVFGNSECFPRIALEVDDGLLASRQSLRRTITTVRQEIGHLDALVATGSPEVAHRGLLIAEGIRTLCVDRFEQVARGSRRPAPNGWPCRSVVWGLWEVAAETSPSVRLLDRMLPWQGGRVLAAGTLSVIHLLGTVEGGARAIRSRLERVLGMVAGRRSKAPVHAALLSELPELLMGGDQAHAGSVLKAA